MKHAHAENDDQEAPYGAHHVHGWHGTPLFKQNDGRGQNYSGEEDVIDGVDQQCVEGVQRFVQVVDLDNDGSQQSQ